NIEDVAARHLLDDFPIAEGCESPHILIAHLDPLGQWLLVQAALDWQVSGLDGKCQLHVSVLDDKAGERIKSLTAEHPYATRACTFHDASLTAGGMRELLLTHEKDPAVPPISYAFVTAFRDEQGLETALRLQHQLVDRDTDVPVVAALARAHGVSSLVRDSSGGALKIKVFQTLKHVCTTDVLEAGMMETTLARHIHEHWRKMARTEGRSDPSWEDADSSDRESSRALARDIPVKLRKIKCKIGPVGGSGDTEYRLTANDIEILARDEHNRWWKDRITAGWTYATDRDNAKKQHPSMKPFEQLRTLEADKDRQLVSAIPDLLASMQCRIVERSS
ncbi:MAG: hypothetical protein QOD39_1898, partial [Mycobacterium sp.]|nr:hypothetical protein [Mycobacterium sp.]